MIIKERWRNEYLNSHKNVGTSSFFFLLSSQRKGEQGAVDLPTRICKILEGCKNKETFDDEIRGLDQRRKSTVTWTREMVQAWAQRLPDNLQHFFKGLFVWLRPIRPLLHSLCPIYYAICQLFPTALSPTSQSILLFIQSFIN